MVLFFWRVGLSIPPKSCRSGIQAAAYVGWQGEEFTLGVHSGKVGPRRLVHEIRSRLVQNSSYCERASADVVLPCRCGDVVSDVIVSGKRVFVLSVGLKKVGKGKKK